MCTNREGLLSISLTGYFLYVVGYVRTDFLYVVGYVRTDCPVTGYLLYVVGYVRTD